MKVNTKSRKVNKAWLNDHVNDPYVKMALREGYRARAAYKLKEIDESLGLIRPGQLVVERGDAQVRLGQDHFDVVDQRRGERPVGVHLAE